MSHSQILQIQEMQKKNIYIYSRGARFVFIRAHVLDIARAL